MLKIKHLWRRPLRLDTTHDVEEISKEGDFSQVTFSSRLGSFAWMSKHVAIYLLPSWISNRFTPSAQTKTTPKIAPTDYLNGIRGIAACAVFFQHYLTLFYSGWPFAGYGTDQTGPHFLQLPFVRLLYAGKFSVAIFYVLSGYVLAYKPMRLIRESNTKALADHLVSAIFRRFLRLFLPIVPPMIFVAWMAVHGYMPDRGVPSEVLGISIVSKDWWQNLTQYFVVYDKTITPWTYDDYHPPYIEALYTLKVEFRGSIMVFTLCLGLAKCKQWMRMGTLAGVSLYALTHGRWDSFLFTQGIIMAEYKHIKLSRAENTPLPKFMLNANLSEHRYRLAKRIIWSALFVLGLFLGSWPLNGSSASFGFHYLTKLTPSLYATQPAGIQNFWLAISALILLWVFESLPILQRPFNTAVVRYLGDISFSLYAIHFPVIYMSFNMVMVPMIRWTGSYNMGCLINAFAFVIPVSFWLSDVQWRLFDLGSVKFTRALEGWVAA